MIFPRVDTRLGITVGRVGDHWGHGACIPCFIAANKANGISGWMRPTMHDSLAAFVDQHGPTRVHF